MAKPLVPWLGGKRKLASEILPLFPEHTCYVEPFCGAAALFFLKEPSRVEVLNDVNHDLVNLYRVVKHHLEELYRQFKWVLCSRQNWEWLNATPPSTLTDVQRAARFLYLQKLAFGGRVTGQSYGTGTTSRPKFNLLTLETDLTEAHFRLAHAQIERMDWQELVRRYDRPHTLFYCDPPYWQVEGYGVEFAWAEYEALAAFMATCTGHVVLSLNKHPDIEALFRDFTMIEIEYEYTVGAGAERCSGVELVIGTWPDGPPERQGQVGLF